MSRYVAVKTGGVVTVHLPDTTGNYYTLCRMDGNDENHMVDQHAVNVPQGAKVNCVDCRLMFEVAARYTRKDFDPITDAYVTDAESEDA